MTLDEFIKKIPSFDLDKIPYVHIFGIGDYSNSGIMRFYANDEVDRVDYDFRKNKLIIHLHKDD